MTLYLGHATALAIYDSGKFSPASGGSRVALSAMQAFPVGNDDLVSFAQAYSLPFPLCVTVPSAARARPRLHLYCTVLGKTELAKEFYPLSDGVCIATPELALLQVAPDMEFLPLVVLVSQLCSRFRVSPEAKCGFEYREPVSSKERILAMLSKVGKYRGSEKLRTATTFAVENARSPAEVKIPLRLSLPQKYFGYGIAAPRINARIDLPIRGMSRLSSREVDFFWEQAGLIGEYNSRENHGEQKLAADTLRANELIGAGYTLVSIIPEQSENIGGMDQIAACIATHVYAHRTYANRQAIYARILRSDPEIRDGRSDLKNKLDYLFSFEVWRLPLGVCQKRIRSRREARNERRRQKYLARERAAEVQ